MSAEVAALTTEQVADQLNVSVRFVVRLARNGVMPYERSGRQYRFTQRDVDRYSERSDGVRRAALDALAPAGGYTDADFRIHDLDEEADQ